MLPKDVDEEEEEEEDIIAVVSRRHSSSSSVVVVGGLRPCMGCFCMYVRGACSAERRRLESAAPVRSDSRVSPPVGVAWRYTKLPHR